MEIEIKSQTIMFVAKIFKRLFGDDVPVEISATANGAALTAGSGSSAATLPLATARVIEVGEVVAEVGSLIRAVSAFPRREIVIASSDDSRAIVFADGMRLKLDHEFGKPLRPDKAESGAACAVVDAGLLFDMVDAVRHAMACAFDRPSLKSLRLEISDDLCLAAAATDGRRLSFVERWLKDASIPKGGFQVTLPAVAVDFILSAPHGSRVSIFVEKHSVTILTGSSLGRFFSDIGFPKWRDVVPAEEPPQVAGLSCQETAAALRALLTFAGFDEDSDDDYAPHVRITREKDSVELKRVVARNVYERTGDFTAHIDVGLTELPPFSVTINAKYLLDALGEHTCSVIIRARKNESDAGYGVLQLDFEDDADIHEVIMPIREI